MTFCSHISNSRMPLPRYVDGVKRYINFISTLTSVRKQVFNIRIDRLYLLFFFVLSHLRQDSPENIRGQENGMIPVSWEPHIPSFTHLVKYINRFPGQRQQ